MARNRIIDFSQGGRRETDGGGGAPSQPFIPWSDVGAQTASPSWANHSGQAQAQAAVDPELLELAALEAAERAYRPQAHGKDSVFTTGYTVNPGPVSKGELAQGAQRGVGQPSLDGFTHPRQAAIQEFLVRTAVPTALKLGGAVLRPFIQTSRGE